MEWPEEWCDLLPMINTCFETVDTMLLGVTLLLQMSEEFISAQEQTSKRRDELKGSLTKVVPDILQRLLVLLTQVQGSEVVGVERLALAFALAFAFRVVGVERLVQCGRAAQTGYCRAAPESTRPRKAVRTPPARVRRQATLGHPPRYLPPQVPSPLSTYLPRRLPYAVGYLGR